MAHALNYVPLSALPSLVCLVLEVPLDNCSILDHLHARLLDCSLGLIEKQK